MANVIEIALGRLAQPLDELVPDYEGLLRHVGDARFVLPAEAPKVGFYGLDLYSLRASMQAVLRHLETVDPPASARVRERYACFDHAGDDAQVYGLLTDAGVTSSCEEDVVRALLELQRRPVAGDEDFDAVQNARLVKNAEAYYRTMFLGNVSSWNQRDRHMVETFEALVAHLERRSRGA